MESTGGCHARHQQKPSSRPEGGMERLEANKAQNAREWRVAVRALERWSRALVMILMILATVAFFSLVALF